MLWLVIETINILKHHIQAKQLAVVTLDDVMMTPEKQTTTTTATTNAQTLQAKPEIQPIPMRRMALESVNSNETPQKYFFDSASSALYFVDNNYVAGLLIIFFKQSFPFFKPHSFSLRFDKFNSE